MSILSTTVPHLASLSPTQYANGFHFALVFRCHSIWLDLICKILILITYLSDCVSTVSTASGRYRLMSTGSEAYILPRTRTRFGERGFFYSDPAAWNTLPSDLHDITDTSTFRKRLKDVFFERAFNWSCWRSWTCRIAAPYKFCVDWLIDGTCVTDTLAAKGRWAPCNIVVWEKPKLDQSTKNALTIRKGIWIYSHLYLRLVFMRSLFKSSFTVLYDWLYCYFAANIANFITHLSVFGGLTNARFYLLCYENARHENAWCQDRSHVCKCLRRWKNNCPAMTDFVD